MIKNKSYSHYTKQELIEELNLMIDNCNDMEWQLENQAKYINQNYIPIEWIRKYMTESLTNGSLMWCSLEAFLKDWEKENEIDN